MFRLSESGGAERTVIRISGGLVGEYARLAEETCAKAIAAGKRVQVLLQQLTGVDEMGRQMLIELIRRGVALRGLDLYSKQLLKIIRRSSGSPSKWGRKAG